jgi:hypothetical protein
MRQRSVTRAGCLPWRTQADVLHGDLTHHHNVCAPQQQQVLATMGSVVWREKLEEAVSATDAASSALVSDFTSGDVPLELFVQQHVEQRTQHHVLDLKRQAAEALLAAADTAGGAGGAAGPGGFRPPSA